MSAALMNGTCPARFVYGLVSYVVFIKPLVAFARTTATFVFSRRKSLHLYNRPEKCSDSTAPKRIDFLRTVPEIRSLFSVFGTTFRFWADS